MAHCTNYDLLLPAFVADALAKVLSPVGPFCRLEELYTPKGMNTVRLMPPTFDSAETRSAYVESRLHHDLSRDGQMMGCVMEQAACNTQAAADIFRFAMEGKRFEAKAADWILNRSPFFLCCRGFEINRITYHFDFDFDFEEKNTVDISVCGVSVNQEPKPINVGSAVKLRFRGMVNS